MPDLTIDVVAIPEDGLEVAIAVPSTAFSLESSDVHLRDPVEFRARITRSGTTVAVKGTIAAAIEVPCVRCLEAAVIDVEEPIDVVVLPASEAPGEEDHELASAEIDLYYVEERLDLRTIIWDHLAVTVPIQPLCRADCKGLCPSCGADRNRETCDCAAETVDDRLAVLRKLKPKDDPD